MTSLLIGLAGIVLTVTLMAAEWYLWEPRYRGAELSALSQGVAEEGSDNARSRISGRRTASFGPQSLQAKVLSKPAQSAWMGGCAQS